MENSNGDGSLPGDYLGNGIYRIAKVDMEGAKFFTPGLPDPNDPDLEQVPFEPIGPDTVLRPVDVVLFYDPKSRHPVDGGFNQWAFVVDDRKALFARGLVHAVKLNDVRKLKGAVVLRRIPEEIAPAVQGMLLAFRFRPSLFRAAIDHLYHNNYQPFVLGGFFPDAPQYDSEQEYEDAWSEFKSRLQPRDAIFTFDSRSIVSRTIARVTHGPYSHVAVHVKDGLIVESVTSGTRQVSIETYKGKHFRVAAYRNYDYRALPQDEFLRRQEAFVPKRGYNYVGAAKAGFKAFLGNHRGALTPNSIIYEGYMAFIGQV